jgi:hypothetical protein
MSTTFDDKVFNTSSSSSGDQLEVNSTTSNGGGYLGQESGYCGGEFGIERCDQGK